MKIKSVILLLLIVFLLGGCSTPETKSQKALGTDKRVLSAITILEEHWNKEYERIDIEDKYLEVINTRIVNIKDNIDSEEIYGKGKLFENIDYIVEFELLSNYHDTAPYYFNAWVNNWVIVYKDGTKEVSGNLLNIYRTSTYSNDFSPIIESIEDFQSDYDQVLEIE